MPIESVHSLLDLIALPIPDFVDVSYQILLERRPARAERDERAGAVRAGLGRTRFLADMCMSPEYEQRWDHVLKEGDDVAFVEAMFRRYLNRSADPDGSQHYVNLLGKGKSRSRTARDIASSREAKTERTFWFELNHLVAAERAERHWFRRWFGHGRRSRMLRNVIQEAQMQCRPQFVSVSQPAIAPQSMSFSQPVLISQSNPAAAALASDRLFQGYGSRRVLSRLRHAAGAM